MGIKKLTPNDFQKTSRPSVSPFPQEAARRAEKEAEERRQKEQEEPAFWSRWFCPHQNHWCRIQEVKRLAELEKEKDKLRIGVTVKYGVMMGHLLIIN